VLWLAFSSAIPARAEPVPSFLGKPQIQRARAYIRGQEPLTLASQVTLCEVAAPPFEERERGQAFRDLLHEAGLDAVRIDAEGNVIGQWGRASDVVPDLILSAHLDTVFPAGTDVSVRREGTLMHGPGIVDDCRGLAVVVAVARTLAALNLATPGRILLVGTVGEEGLGDLRGVRALFSGSDVDSRHVRFISLDGAGMAVTSGGVGSRRYRVTFHGPGGHSYGDFGQPSPIHAAGRAIAAVADFVTPASPRTTFNVGRVGGGTSVNSIADAAWFEVDLRSEDPGALARLDDRFQAEVRAAEQAENARSTAGRAIRAEIVQVGDRPAGSTPVSAPLVRWALELSKALGTTVRPGSSSTDANFPMSLGVPAVTLGAGGTGTGVHSPGETFDSRGSALGAERALLLTLAMAGLAEGVADPPPATR
jgi:tripeptide aminopeptidase